MIGNKSLSSNFMTSRPEKQLQHIYCPISQRSKSNETMKYPISQRSKSNETMKYDQLIQARN